MTDRPILFSAPMVRALLDGRKTQTRRVIKWQGPKGYPHSFDHARIDNPAGVQRLLVPYRHPGDPVDPWDDCAMVRHYGAFDPGDRLWVREAHYLTDDGDHEYAVYAADAGVGEHLARIDRLPSYFSEALRAKHKRLRPGIHMPRWASRLTLAVTDVRVQRLQEISEASARAEGMSPLPSGRYFCGHDEEGEIACKSAITAFAWAWNAINGERPGCHWQDNPWVVAITFEVTRGNIDRLGPAR